MFVGEHRRDAHSFRLLGVLGQRQHAICEGGAALEDLAAGFQALDSADGGEQLHHITIGGFGYVDVVRRFSTRANNALDHADLFVALGIVETAAAPVGDIQARKAINIHVDGVRHLDEHRLFDGVAGGFALHRVVVDIAGGPVAGEQRVGEGLGEPRLIQPECAGARTTAEVGERDDGLVLEVLVQARVTVVTQVGEVVETGVPALAIVGVVAREQVHRRRDGHVAVVARHDRIGLQFRTIGTHTGNTAAEQFDARAIGALGTEHAEVAHRDVEPAVDAHAHRIGGVVGAARVFDAAT